jgi:hypothetical protein
MNARTYPALAIAVFAFCGGGCSGVVKHQKGGRASQSLGVSIPPMDYMGMPPEQFMEQPENPVGESRQAMARTVTTVDPASGVVTSTTEHAETTIGGSQDLAKIIKQKVGADHLRNLIAALLMAAVAWLCRREWPIVGVALGVGAVVVAFFGIAWAVGFAGFGLGAVVIYYAARSQIPFQLAK